MGNLNQYADALRGSASLLGEKLVQVSIQVALAVLVFIVGWVIGVLISQAIQHIIKASKLDKLLSAAGVDDLVGKMGMKLNSGRFLGELGKWYVIVVALIMSFDVLNLTQVTEFLTDIATLYLPKVISAVLILIIAAVVADAMRKVVVASAKGAGVNSANLVGSITNWSIWIFGVLIALFELGVAATLIQTLFMGIVVAIALALGLSFGLGGQDAARDYISKVKKEISARHD